MISIQIETVDGAIIASAEGKREVNLPVNYEYQEGDCIRFHVEETNCLYYLQADDAMGEALVYVTGDVVYEIPFGEKKVCYSPKVFSGRQHLISARKASEQEAGMYRNLALNVMDQHSNTTGFPHASANVETRGESVFAARNAIDGITANHSHGEWPYGSWGINRDPNAIIRIDFGREVSVDQVEIYLRADFPHDSWWTQATLRFSDESTLICPLVKTDEGQKFHFEAKKISWVQMEQMQKADDPSPFPALTQLKVFGC